MAYGIYVAPWNSLTSLRNYSSSLPMVFNSYENKLFKFFGTVYLFFILIVHRVRKMGYKIMRAGARARVCVYGGGGGGGVRGEI